MALGDTDDVACSRHGRQNPVVLYCHTCQMLLCPRCVSHGPAGEEPAHRDHTYLEIQDAHDMFKVLIPHNTGWAKKTGLFSDLITL